MDYEKKPIESSQSEGRTQKPTMIAVATAVTLGVVLVVVCISGGVYITQLKTKGVNNTDKQHEITINYINDYNGELIKQTSVPDSSKNLNLEKQHDVHGNLIQVAVTDYNTQLFGIYNVKIGECYLFHVTDNFNGLEDLFKEEDEFVRTHDISETFHMNSTRADYTKGNRPISDHSILPESLQPYCENKATYWMKAVERHDREKRQVYDCYYAGHHCCPCTRTCTIYLACFER